MTQHLSWNLMLILALLALLALAGLLAVGPLSPSATVAVAPAGGWPADEPTAVVLSTFSADIRGPSRSLWLASTSLLLVGAVIVRQVYARRE